MSKLRFAFIIFLAVVALLPLGDVLDDSSFNFSHIKNSFESIDSYDDRFIEDVSRLGFFSEILTHLFDGYNTFRIYCTEQGWINHDPNFVSDDGYVSMKVIYGTDSSQLDEVDFPTRFNVYVDDYSDYQDFCIRYYRPIEKFVESYNIYISQDNILVQIISLVGLLIGGFYGFFYMIFVFLFDSITMVWGLVLCLLRLIGLVPLPV